MDHRITVMVIIVFGGTVAFTLFSAMLFETHLPSAAVASGQGPGTASEAGPGAETGHGRGEEPQGPSPRELLIITLQSLDGQVGRWTRDHNGRQPDFATYPQWQQFVGKTSLTGKPTADGLLGPYLSSVPVNPLNHLSTVLSVDGPLGRAQRVPAGAPAEGVGFVYSRADQCFWGTNGTGRVILTRGSSPGASVPTPR
jgi:hypothetical protein